MTSLIYHERIVTTVPKAKELARLADRVIGHAKNGKIINLTKIVRFFLGSLTCGSPFGVHKVHSMLDERQIRSLWKHPL